LYCHEKCLLFQGSCNQAAFGGQGIRAKKILSAYRAVGSPPHTEDCHLPDNTGRFIDMARMQLYNTSFALHYAEWSARFWFQTIRPDGIDFEN
jgi:hypothetical protein